MRRFILFLMLAAPFLFACASGKPYKPIDRFETLEFSRAAIEVTPEMVRSHLSDYTNTVVAWVGVIKKTEAFEDGKNFQIRNVSLIEHRYYDWIKNRAKSKAPHEVSTRGQGLFRVEWFLNRLIPEATSDEAESLAAPDKVVVVYGIPEKVEADGTVVLSYRYLRVFKGNEVDARSVDFGSADEPFRYVAH